MKAQMSRPNVPVWTLKGPEKGSEVRRMFSSIAGNYDRINGIISLQAHKRWRRDAVQTLSLAPGAQTLDLCCGTGDFAIPLRDAVGPRGTVIGVDFALPMLSLAQKKDAKANYLSADALVVPIRSNQFDGITVGWGVRNVADIDAFHREVFRLLKPGGRFVSVDTAKPENPLIRVISRVLISCAVPLVGWLAGHLDAYRYLPASTESFWSRSELSQSMAKAGLVNVGFSNRMAGNICIHWGQKP